jgi:RNA polymerase sigma factor (sigma-70 family)
MAEIPATRPSLLVRLRDRHDEAAWNQFVDLYAPVVYGYARKQGLQDADAADLSQDVFRAIAGAIDRLDYDPSKGAFRNWLFTIVRRKLLNWRAAHGNRPQGSGDTDTHRLLEQCAAPEPADAEWATEWQTRLFQWACTQVRRDVAETSWQAFWKTTVDDLPGKQVAADLGLSVTAVYSARSRILARLKELIQSVQEPGLSPRENSHGDPG